MVETYRKPHAQSGTGADDKETLTRQERDRIQALLDAFGYTWHRAGEAYRGRTYSRYWELLAPNGRPITVTEALAHIAMQLDAAPDQEAPHRSGGA